MRILSLTLLCLLALIQYPLWLGKGGWLRVWDLDRQVRQVQQGNATLKSRNERLESEVRDLKDGTGAVEERARLELGMVRKDEIFVQVLQPGSVKRTTPPPLPAVTDAQR